VVGRLYPGSLGRQTKHSVTAGRRVGGSVADFQTSLGKKLQLFSRLLCPVIETQSMDMNSNIIYLDFETPETNRQQGKRQGNWIRIENDAAFKIIDTFLVFWLGAWSLVAGVEFLRATGTVLF
jgi:hypothetical protein